jgi:hypothetical protein
MSAYRVACAVALVLSPLAPFAAAYAADGAIPGVGADVTLPTAVIVAAIILRGHWPPTK